MLDIAAESGIIDKSGAWYSYGSQRIGQGRENAKMYLKDNPALLAEVEEKVSAGWALPGKGFRGMFFWSERSVGGTRCIRRSTLIRPRFSAIRYPLRATRCQQSSVELAHGDRR